MALMGLPDQNIIPGWWFTTNIVGKHPSGHSFLQRWARLRLTSGLPCLNLNVAFNLAAWSSERQLLTIASARFLFHDINADIGILAQTIDLSKVQCLTLWHQPQLHVSNIDVWRIIMCSPHRTLPFDIRSKYMVSTIAPHGYLDQQDTFVTLMQASTNFQTSHSFQHWRIASDDYLALDHAWYPPRRLLLCNIEVDVPILCYSPGKRAQRPGFNPKQNATLHATWLILSVWTTGYALWKQHPYTLHFTSPRLTVVWNAFLRQQQRP